MIKNGQRQLGGQEIDRKERAGRATVPATRSDLGRTANSQYENMSTQGDKTG